MHSEIVATSLGESSGPRCIPSRRVVRLSIVLGEPAALRPNSGLRVCTVASGRRGMYVENDF